MVRARAQQVPKARLGACRHGCPGVRRESD